MKFFTEVVLERFDFSLVYAVRKSLGQMESVYTLTRIAEGLLESLDYNGEAKVSDGFLASQDKDGDMTLLYILASSQSSPTETFPQPLEQTPPDSTEGQS